MRSPVPGVQGRQKIAEWLLERKAVHVIASDAHDPYGVGRSCREARDTVAQLVGEDVAEALVTRNPEAIVEGNPLPYLPI